MGSRAYFRPRDPRTKYYMCHNQRPCRLGDRCKHPHGADELNSWNDKLAADRKSGRGDGARSDRGSDRAHSERDVAGAKKGSGEKLGSLASSSPRLGPVSGRLGNGLAPIPPKGPPPTVALGAAANGGGGSDSPRSMKSRLGVSGKIGQTFWRGEVDMTGDAFAVSLCVVERGSGEVRGGKLRRDYEFAGVVKLEAAMRVNASTVQRTLMGEQGTTPWHLAYLRCGDSDKSQSAYAELHDQLKQKEGDADGSAIAATWMGKRGFHRLSIVPLAHCRGLVPGNVLQDLDEEESESAEGGVLLGILTTRLRDSRAAAAELPPMTSSSLKRATLGNSDGTMSRAIHPSQIPEPSDAKMAKYCTQVAEDLRKYIIRGGTGVVQYTPHSGGESQGQVPGTNFGSFYRKHPAAKALVKRAGGPRKFCIQQDGLMWVDGSDGLMGNRNNSVGYARIGPKRAKKHDRERHSSSSSSKRDHRDATSSRDGRDNSSRDNGSRYASWERLGPRENPRESPRESPRDVPRDRRDGPLPTPGVGQKRWRSREENDRLSKVRVAEMQSTSSGRSNASGEGGIVRYERVPDPTKYQRGQGPDEIPDGKGGKGGTGGKGSKGGKGGKGGKGTPVVRDHFSTKGPWNSGDEGGQTHQSRPPSGETAFAREENARRANIRDGRADGRADGGRDRWNTQDSAKRSGKDAFGRDIATSGDGGRGSAGGDAKRSRLDTAPNVSPPSINMSSNVSNASGDDYDPFKPSTPGTP